VRRVLAADPPSFRFLQRKDWKPPKCYMASESDVVAWILEPFSERDRVAFVDLREHPSNFENGKPAHKSFDTSIMELADDIAYGVHDLEDAIALHMLTVDDLNLVSSSFDADWKRK